MKRLSIVLVFTFVLLSSLYSQERNTTKEVGIYFSNLDAFGIRYKFGNEKHMFRITALSINFGNSNSNANGTTVENTNSGAGLNIGFELPVNITENFTFYYGGELSGAFGHFKYSSHDTETSSTSNTTNTGIGFVLGFSHRINANILISAEIVPGLHFYRTENGSNEDSGYGFGLYSNAAGITLSYRFNTK